MTILATPVQLHEKIQKMNGRVHELEEALRQAQARVSPNAHPLLVQNIRRNPSVEKSDRLLSVSGAHSDALFHDVPYGSEEATPPKAMSPTDGLSRAFGTLSITPGRGLKVCLNFRAGSTTTDCLSGMAKPRRRKTSWK